MPAPDSEAGRSQLHVPARPRAGHFFRHTTRQLLYGAPKVWPRMSDTINIIFLDMASLRHFARTFGPGFLLGVATPKPTSRNIPSG